MIKDSDSPVAVLKPHLVMFAGEARTTSLAIAKHFGKQHKDVLKALRNLDCSADFTERNFALCFENNSLQNGKPQPYYRMTRDGFAFLVMGFTGAKAAAWKEAYIRAFNAMEQRLRLAADERLAHQQEEYEKLYDVTLEAVERVQALLAQCNELSENNRVLRSEMDSLRMRMSMVESRVTGPEELGVLTAICDFEALDASVLGFLLRKACEYSDKPYAVQASSSDLAVALACPSVSKIRDAVIRLRKLGLIHTPLPRRGRTHRFVVNRDEIEARLKAIGSDPHLTLARLTMVPDAESPLAKAIRKVVGYPKSQHDDQIEDMITRRNYLPTTRH